MTDFIAGPIAAWMASVMELMSSWLGAVGAGDMLLGLRLSVTFRLSLIVDCGVVRVFLGMGVGEGSIRGPFVAAVVCLLPRGVVEGESSLIALVTVAPVLGVEPEMVRFLPVVGVEEQVASGVCEGFLWSPREAAASKKYFTFLLRTAEVISASWFAARLSI